jgi:hypothetical protein
MIVHGDCVAEMAKMPEASVPACRDCGREFPGLPAAYWHRPLLCHACAVERTPDP